MFINILLLKYDSIDSKVNFSSNLEKLYNILIKYKFVF